MTFRSKIVSNFVKNTKDNQKLVYTRRADTIRGSRNSQTITKIATEGKNGRHVQGAVMSLVFARWLRASISPAQIWPLLSRTEVVLGQHSDKHSSNYQILRAKDFSSFTAVVKGLL